MVERRSATQQVAVVGNQDCVWAVDWDYLRLGVGGPVEAWSNAITGEWLAPSNRPFRFGIISL